MNPIKSSKKGVATLLKSDQLTKIFTAYKGGLTVLVKCVTFEKRVHRLLERHRLKHRFLQIEHRLLAPLKTRANHLLI